MTRAAARSGKLDGRDTGSLESLASSRGWQLIEQRLAGELAKQVADLERTHTEVETATIRGKVEMLRLALRLPEQLRAESRKGRPSDE